jgi:signal transduction histidine kinase
LTLDGDQSALPGGVPIAVYRLVQEAVNNAVKHAHATCLDVTLARSATTLTVTITDDGIGMESHAMTKGRLGLIGMRERAYRLGGSFDIGPGPAGRGTRVAAEFDAPRHEELNTSSAHLVKGEQARFDSNQSIGRGQDHWALQVRGAVTP